VLELIGWTATALFASSYFFSTPSKLRWIQACAAVMWIAYGAMIGAKPVVVSNLIVAVAAAYTTFAGKRELKTA
jgi:hypothetical protein